MMAFLLFLPLLHCKWPTPHKWPFRGSTVIIATTTTTIILIMIMIITTTITIMKLKYLERDPTSL